MTEPAKKKLSPVTAAEVAPPPADVYAPKPAPPPAAPAGEGEETGAGHFYDYMLGQSPLWPMVGRATLGKDAPAAPTLGDAYAAAKPAIDKKAEAAKTAAVEEMAKAKEKLDAARQKVADAIAPRPRVMGSLAGLRRDTR